MAFDLSIVDSAAMSLVFAAVPAIASCQRSLWELVRTAKTGVLEGDSAPECLESSGPGAPDGTSAPKSCKNSGPGAPEGDFAPEAGVVRVLACLDSRHDDDSQPSPVSVVRWHIAKS